MPIHWIPYTGQNFRYTRQTPLIPDILSGLRGSVVRVFVVRGSVVGGSVVVGSVVVGSVVGGSIVGGSVVRGFVERGSVVRGSVVRGSSGVITLSGIRDWCLPDVRYTGTNCT